MSRATKLLAFAVLLFAVAAGAQNADLAAVAGSGSVGERAAARVVNAVRQAGPGPNGPASVKAAKPESKPAAARQGAEKESSATGAKTGKVITGKGRRDPFVSVVGAGSGEPPVCTAGKKCLRIQQLVVRGVAKNGNGMLALVENAQRRSYFLRVHETVFDGEVAAITKDAVVFREKIVDRVGRAHTREVVKRVDGKAQDTGIAAQRPAI
jgi:hypothetical protein